MSQYVQFVHTFFSPDSGLHYDTIDLTPHSFPPNSSFLLPWNQKMNFLGNRRIKYFSKAGMLPRTKKYSCLLPNKATYCKGGEESLPCRTAGLCI